MKCDNKERINQIHEMKDTFTLKSYYSTLDKIRQKYQESSSPRLRTVGLAWE